MSSDAPGAPPKRSFLLLLLLGFLFIMVPFLFWHDTWFGRKLSNQEMGEYLQDSAHPRKIQHALSQIADQIVEGDAAVRPWYPQIAALAQNPNAIIRTTAAWVMGQDSHAELFHFALLDLLKDPEIMVRRNAALALVRFQDASGRTELRKMLQPYSLESPAEGTVSIQSQPGESVSSGSLLLRIRTTEGREVEVRSPFSGRVDRILPRNGSRVGMGDEVVSVSPEADQVGEALRGLSLVGEVEDLGEVEHCEDASDVMPERIRQQAVLTAKAIRTRAERNPSR
jgi:HEAT repeat protein